MSNSDEHRVVDALYSDEDAEGLTAEQSQELSELSDTLSLMRQLEEVEPPPFMATRILAEAKSLQSAPSGWRKWIAVIASPVGGLVATAGLAAVVVVATLPMADQMSPTSEEPASVSVKTVSQEVAAAAPQTAADELNEELAGEVGGFGAEGAADKGAMAEGEADAIDDADGEALGASRSLRRRSKAKSRVRRTFPADAKEVPAEPAAEKESKDDSSLDDFSKSVATGRGEGARSDRDAADDVLAQPTPRPPAAAAPSPPPPPPSKREASRGAPAKSAPGPESPKAGEAQNPEAVAKSFIQAAQAELNAGRRRAARQVLARGVEQTRGKAAQALLYLKWAEIELEDRQPTVARTYLASARRVSGFKEHKRAQVIEGRIVALEAEMSVP